jgi:hypothetical protein
LERNNNKEKGSGRVGSEFDVKGILQQIDKDIGDINWISQCESLKQQCDELICKQSWLVERLLKCGHKKRALLRVARILVDENNKLQKNVIPYSIQKLADFTSIEDFVLEEEHAQALEDMPYRNKVNEGEVNNDSA